MKFGKERMASFVNRGNLLIVQKKETEAMKMVERGLEHYTKKVLNAIQPYAAADAGLLVIVLRHLADELEIKNEGAKELAEGLSKCLVFPDLEEVSKVQKPNRE